MSLVGFGRNLRKPLDIALTWEGNYWDDQDVHDCCDVDWETCEILVRKIAKAFLLPTSPIDKIDNYEKILIFLPKLMQLPLAILAAYHAGLVSIIMDPLTCSSELLEEIVGTEKIKLLVTVDAVWQAQQLIEIKKNIENIRGMDQVQLLVLRHAAPNHGVPPPKKNYPARRPSYKTLLDLRDGRDWEWSTVMASIQIDETDSDNKEFAWKNDDVIMKLIDGQGKTHSLSKTHVLDALESRKSDLTAKFAEVSRSQLVIENVMIMDEPNNLESLVNLLVPWYMGKTLTLYEGPFDYPDSSRLAQIISKHNVNCLLGAGSNYSLPNPDYLKFFDFSNLQILDTPNFPEFSIYFAKNVSR